MIQRMQIFHALRLAPVLLLAAASQLAAAEWVDFDTDAGGRVRVVGGASPGLAAVGLYLPAGTVACPDLPQLAQLGPIAFLGSAPLAGGSGNLGEDLARRGWSFRKRCDLDGAGFVLAGPRGDLELVLDRVLDRLEGPGAVEQADLDLAWAALEGDWRRWAGQDEVRLRKELAALHHGAHPFAVGLARLRPANAAPPALAELSDFLAENYQAGAMILLVAGDIEVGGWLDRWRSRLEVLPGHQLPPAEILASGLGAGELRLPTAGGSLLVAHYGLPRSGSADAAAASVLAGVLAQFLRLDVMERGLARSAAAWFDFTSSAPMPLEIQMRDFDPKRLTALRAQLDRIIDRMRKGEFSEYQVISAKDIILGRMDDATAEGAGPPDGDAFVLGGWCERVLRQSLDFDGRRRVFENQLMGTGKSELMELAQRMLSAERETLGLLIPEAQLE